MNPPTPVYVLEPRIARVGSIRLPLVLLDAYPQIVVAIVPRPGFAANTRPESVLLIRALVRDRRSHFGDLDFRALVVKPGRDLDILTRVDEFSLEIPRADLDAIQAAIH